MPYTPLQFAKDECANFNESHGSCFGVTADSLLPRPGEKPRACPRPKCLLADGERCGYFERIVLPLAERGNPRFLAAREAYYGSKALRTARLPGFNAVRQCECGNPLAAGHRLCEKCKASKRRLAYRAEKRRQRV